EGKKGVVKLLVKLATLDHDSYQMLHQMLTLHSNGKLKGQKLSPVDIANGPDLRPYTFVGLPELRPSAIQRVLFEVRDNVMSVSEMQEVKLLHKLLRVQRFFVDLVGATSWDMMLRLVFLGETTREVLKHFCKCNLRSTLGELKTFCRQLQREEDMKFDGFQGADGAIGTLLNLMWHCLRHRCWRTFQYSVDHRSSFLTCLRHHPTIVIPKKHCVEICPYMSTVYTKMQIHISVSMVRWWMTVRNQYNCIHELILAFTCPKDWVIDACSGTGNCQM
ncbi:hypothetical protein BSL78_28137, partial [Apostichopus japonicus]